MNLVTLEGITHQYSERVLLQDASLLINQGDRVGLIGPNGSGKSTLLRLIADLESPDTGSITIWGGVRIQYLAQDPPLDPDKSVLDTLFASDSPQMRLLRRYEQALARLAAEPGNQSYQQQLARLTDEMDRANGWTAEANAKSILTRLGITSFDAQVGQLSGGRQKRVALARALLDPADLLILDEPTNHIDADAIAWLEEYLRDVPALLMVTHDRYFLDRVCNRIVELDRRELVSYPGNYQSYLQRSEERQERLAAQEEKRRIMLRQELEWLRRGVKARGTKQKFRKQRVGELLQISQDKGENQLAWMLATGRRLGKSVLRAQGLSKAFGEQIVFDNIDFELEPGARLGIIGPNGSGKTTFLDVLAGLEEADSGTIEWGETVHLGYYDQHGDDLKDDMKVIDFIEQDAALIRTKNGERVDAAQMLDWFLFPRPQQHAKVGSLSGGERRRLYLLHMLVHQPNVIFLDEPTNDLDIEILQVLESFLDNFQGSLIVVSHDRYFLDRTVDYLFNIEEGHLGTRYPGPYENYQRIQEEKVAAQIEREKLTKASTQASKASKQKQENSSDVRKLSWKEQREMEQVEQEIAQWEAQKQRIATALNAAGSDYERVMALSAELETVNANLESAEWRWLELTERQ